MTTIEYRRSKYEKKRKALMEAGRIDAEDMETIVKQLQDVLADESLDMSRLGQLTDVNNQANSTYPSTPGKFIFWILLCTP